MRKATSRLTPLKKAPTGIHGLDEITYGGLPAGRPTLVCGSAGCGKSLFGLEFLVRGAIQYGEPGVLMTFEERADDIARNVASLGFDTDALVAKKKLVIDFVKIDRGEIEEHGEYDLEGLFIRLAHSIAAIGAKRVVLDTIEALLRPAVFGLEMHLVRMHKLISQFQPSVVIVDPVSNLQTAGTNEDTTHLFVRLVDFLRKNGILGFLVSLTGGERLLEATDEGISSMVDTWLLLRDLESNGERNKVLYVLKSRGMAHSNQVREFHITTKGVKLVAVYLGPAGVLTGSARLAQEAQAIAVAQVSRQELERKKLALTHRRKAMEAQIEALRAEFHAEEEELRRAVASEKIRLGQIEIDREAMARSRRVTARPAKNNHR
jgi:KaiC/GvpD/RAD55 family RecA-like ATPase